MYPGTIFNWHDNSGIQTTTTSVASESAPLLMQVFSADKGTEELIEISGSTNFDAMYGTMSFSRHGQSAIQAKRIIDAGGRLLAKRVVASDSTLANLVLVATVSSKTDGVSVKWESKSYENCKTFEDVKAKVLENDYKPAEGKYPVFIYTDNGRGSSLKAVRLVPDYATSKNAGHTFYTLNVYEGTTVTEQTAITVDPDVIYGGNAYRLDKYTNVQISGVVLDSVFDDYATKIADNLAIDVATAKSYDIVYGYTNRGIKLTGFELASDSVDLDAETGISLANGSNGKFTDSPMTEGTPLTAWTNAVANIFRGFIYDGSIILPTSDPIPVDAISIDEVFDVDQYMIAAVCDANYPLAVKNAIFDFVEFRKDCVFLRDYGIGLTTLSEIQDYHDDKLADKKNYFTADYVTSYMISDPETRKNIEVTMMYDMAALIVNSIENAPYAPLAGVSNGFILSSAIKGTINFVPVNTPRANQKETIDSIHVNYALFEDDDCVVQSCYTSQDEYTQLSYLCNTIAIQRVLRAVRTACPRQRYSLSTSTDLQTYANAVNNVLANYTTNFSTLNFNYTQDTLKAAQKIFYASIEFAFLGWAQTEIFDVYAINN